MKIVFWSGTGNTEKMAHLIAKGIKNKNKNVEILKVSDVDTNVFDNEDILILGCPAMGDETLEECEFEPFIDEISSKVSGKKVALFGSYGWGDGQWMREWGERMESYGCVVAIDSLIVSNEPEGYSEQECIKFGEKIAVL